MNLLKNIFTILSLMLTFSSCQETVKKKKLQNDNDVVSTKLQQKILIDYKSDEYKIYIGDNYKNKEIIDWQWSALDDPDNKIDSTGKDTFLFLGEPLLKYNDDESLPTLYIETEKNIINSFTCIVVFDLADSNNAEVNFLKLLSKDIKLLKKNEVIKSLITNGIYKKSKQGYIETLKLTKGKEYENDKFEYTIKREKNGR